MDNHISLDRWSNIEKFLFDLKNSKLFKDQIVYSASLEGADASFGEIEPPLDPLIGEILKQRSIKELYSHQTEAINILRRGEDVAIATPTASGKSLIYNIAFLEEYLKDQNTTALYLFPLKALSQDQLKEINELFSNLSPFIKKISSEIYDGDSSTYKRQKIRANPPHILITTPDMLHMAILPHHPVWKDFFMNLKIIVVDEMHTYRGVMGSHMAWVFRRLIRICNFYGSYPRFIFCSATIGNAKELIKNLTGRDVKVISKTGSPKGPQELVFINPMLYGPARTGFLLLKSAVIRKIRTIVYTNSRKLTELIGMWCKKQRGVVRERVSVYRAGFLPEQRRNIELSLKNGSITGIVSTSALEAGINIGGLDLCIMVGYPGSVISLKQRAGRVGRSMQKSGVILIGGEDNLDQYILRHPEKFLKLHPENIAINPYNETIMKQHIMCAAYELEINKDEFNLPVEKNIISTLVDERNLIKDEKTDKIFCINRNIHKNTPLRTTSSRLIIQTDTGDVLGYIDLYRAYHETYPGAIYLHNTETYRVEELNIEDRCVICKKVNVKYFTKLITQKETSIVEIYNEKQHQNIHIYFGMLNIKEHFKGFEKRRIKDHSLLNFNELKIDPLEFKTQGLFIKLPMDLKDEVEKRYMHFMGGIHGLEHLLIGVMPYIVLMDRNDIGGISTVYHEELKSPAIFIYDGVSGGIGITKEGYEKIDKLFSLARDILFSCECERGCFMCIYSPKCGSGNRPLDKECSMYILDLIENNKKIEKNIGNVKVKKSYENGDKSPLNPQKNKKTLIFYQKELPAMGLRSLNLSKIKNNKNKLNENQKNSLKNLEIPFVKNFGVLDIETQKSAQEVGGWKNLYAMRVSCAVLYVAKKDDFVVFYEQNINELFSLLKELELVVGFNIKKFDYGVLSYYSPYRLSKLPTLDLLTEIHKRLGYRVSLDNVAKATLDAKKSGDGLMALKWWREGKIDKIVSYCKKDVEITKDVYLFGQQNGFIYFTNKYKKKVRLKVEW